jgi:hypothetical protein
MSDNAIIWCEAGKNLTFMKDDSLNNKLISIFLIYYTFHYNLKALFETLCFIVKTEQYMGHL